MAAPVIRGSTAPAINASGAAVAPSSTQVDDIVVIYVWAQGTVIPTFTIKTDLDYEEVRSHSHNDGTTDGRLAVYRVVATVAGAQTYQPATITNANTAQISVGIRVYQAGTYKLGTWPSNSSTLTTNAVPNPPSVTGLTGDYSVDAIAAWHVTTAGATATTPPTNYTDEIENASASHVTHLSITSRALTGLVGATEDPGAFGDNVTPNGSVSMTIAIPGVVEFTRSAAIDAAGAVTTAGEVEPGFATLERAAAIDGAGAVTSAGEFWSVFDRSAALGATGAIASTGEFWSTLERSAALGAAGDITSAGVGFTTFDRSAAIDAMAAIAASGLAWSTFDRTTAIDAAGAVTVAGVGFTEWAQAAAIDAIGAVIVSGTIAGGFAELERAAAIDGAGVLQASGHRLLDRVLLVDAAGSVVAHGESVRERAAAIDAAGAVTIANHERALQRSVAIEAAGTVSITGGNPSLIYAGPPIRVVWDDHLVRSARWITS